jgi:DNA-binding FadR family transcriptional regulator
MRDDNRQHEILKSEDADRRFHELIASSTQNSGIIAAVQMCGMRAPDLRRAT